MKIWVDDIRPAPEGYVWCKSVNETISLIDRSDSMIKCCMELGNKAFLERNYKNRNQAYAYANKWEIELIDLDHDAGDYVEFGGDYIRILDYLEATRRNYPIRIHSMNPVGRGNMRRIIRKNGWKEIE